MLRIYARAATGCLFRSRTLHCMLIKQQLVAELSNWIIELQLTPTLHKA
jgi:hypothetical protein